MNDLIEPLDWGTLDVFTPFASTAQCEGRIYLCNALEKKESLRPVQEPMFPDAFMHWDSDTTSSGEELTPANFTYFDPVGAAFGPPGEHTRWSYKVEKEPATMPKLRKMTIVNERGVEIIRIKPRCRPWRHITRGCVELAISEWMVKQHALPDGDSRKHNVSSGTWTYRVGNEDRQAAVWLWQGLIQEMDKPDTFKIFL